MKVCNRCSISKDFSEFSKDKSSKDGYQGTCRQCRKLQKKKWTEKNKEKIKVYNKGYVENNQEYFQQYYQKHKEEHAESTKNWAKNNPKRVKESYKKWADSHRDELRERYKKWYSENRKKAIVTSSHYNSQHKEKINKRRVDRRKIDIEYKLRTYLPIAIGQALKNQQLLKTFTYSKYTNFKIPELIRHLESQFTDGMSWDNYGIKGWHIDHIIPQSLYDFSDIEEIRKCWSLPNLRPLAGPENHSKYNSFSWELVEQYDLYDFLPKLITDCV